jgi:hypothetical protein
LMKILCENRELDLGLNFWCYLVEKGYCPHGHALDLLVTGLCSSGRVQEAFDCSKQVLERGRHISESMSQMLGRFLLQRGEMDKLSTLNQMIKKLQDILPLSIRRAFGVAAST